MMLALGRGRISTHNRAAHLVQAKVSRRRVCFRDASPKAVPDNADIASAPVQPKQYLYEPRFGLPVVRRQLSYSELLKSVRQGKVKSISWFKADHKGTAVVDGPCLVEYIDGTLYQSNVPMEEVRVRYAMETHGVSSRGLPTMPTPSELTPYQGFPFQAMVEVAIKNLPFLGFLMIWAAVQFKDILKGDFTDRSQVRKKERSDADSAKMQAREDDKILGLQKMVVNNMDEAAVRKEVARLKLDLEESELQAMLADARRLRARQEQGGWALQEEEEENVRKRQAQLKGEQQTEPEDVNKMRGLKIRKARLRSVNRTRLKGKLKNVEDDEVFFEDVAGIDTAKQELAEIVDFFNFPERYAKSGARSPRGCLLYGPPGTGKTLLARAVAGEANATFLGVNASEFVEMFIGVGAARVRDLFATARENAPAVVFIDEIDAVGRVRGGSVGNDERDQTLNQMLSEMDGFDARSGVVVIAATNRRDILDPALIRPGRFDRQVYVGPPSREGRIDVLRVHLRKFQWKPETMDLHDLAFSTDGYTGAMLSNLCNVAALMANRNGRDAITGEDFRMALQYEHQGLPAGQHTPQVTRRIAVLEAATAVTASLLPAMEPVEYVYTQPTEKRKLGQTVLQDNEQRSMTELYTKQYLEEQLRVVLAGRAAERLLLGEDEVSSLNMENINHARDIVHMLVLGAAMADNPQIGPQMISQPNLSSELSNEVQMYIGPGTSVETLTEAQFQMQTMLKQAEQDAYKLLERNQQALEQVIDKLCREPFEMSGDEVRAIVHKVGNTEDLKALDDSVASFL